MEWSPVIAPVVTLSGMLYGFVVSHTRLKAKLETVGKDVSAQVKGVEERLTGKAELTNQKLEHLGVQIDRMDKHIDRIDDRQHRQEHRLTVLESTNSLLGGRPATPDGDRPAGGGG